MKLSNRFAWAFAPLFSLSFTFAVANSDQTAGHCGSYTPGSKNLYWGDLHVHTAYSLDAWGYGTFNTPADAIAFARGGETKLPDGSPIKLQRPLDFVAITDHAEWLDLLYLCTDPGWIEDPYCNIMREKNAPATGRDVFREYVIPTITLAEPAQTPICINDPETCKKASLSQWQRIQSQVNEADAPCEFTALLGYEWSATPNFSHSHRNIIFAHENG